METIKWINIHGVNVALLVCVHVGWCGFNLIYRDFFSRFFFFSEILLRLSSRFSSSSIQCLIFPTFPLSDLTFPETILPGFRSSPGGLFFFLKISLFVDFLNVKMCSSRRRSSSNVVVLFHSFVSKHSNLSVSNIILFRIRIYFLISSFFVKVNTGLAAWTLLVDRLTWLMLHRSPSLLHRGGGGRGSGRRRRWRRVRRRSGRRRQRSFQLPPVAGAVSRSRVAVGRAVVAAAAVLAPSVVSVAVALRVAPRVLGAAASAEPVGVHGRLLRVDTMVAGGTGSPAIVAPTASPSVVVIACCWKEVYLKLIRMPYSSRPHRNVWRNAIL